MKRVSDEVDDRRGAIGEENRDDVEAAFRGVALMPGEVVAGHGDDATLFPWSDCFGRRAALDGAPGFHFDEDKAIAVTRDDVNFSMARAVSGSKNLVPLALERATGEGFAAGTEGNVGSG